MEEFLKKEKLEYLDFEKYETLCYEACLKLFNPDNSPSYYSDLFKIGKVYIRFADGTLKELINITYDYFVNNILETGMSDIEYEKYKRDNNLHEITDFRFEVIKNSEIIWKLDDITISLFKLNFEPDNKKLIFDFDKFEKENNICL